MRIKHVILLFCSITLLCACAGKTTIHNSNTQNNGFKLLSGKQDHTLELLGFCDDYSNLTPEAQKKVFTSTNQALADNKNDLIQRIRLAVMLALPSSRMRDTAKAQNLLQDLLQENNLSSADATLVSLLYEYTVFDNKKSQKDREDVRKHDILQQKYDALQQKNDALEQKLNELKNIEKTMNERNTKTEAK